MGQPPVPSTWPSPDQPERGQEQPSSTPPPATGEWQQAPPQQGWPQPAPQPGTSPPQQPWPQQPQAQQPPAQQPAQQWGNPSGQWGAPAGPTAPPIAPPPQGQPGYGQPTGQSMYGVRPEPSAPAGQPPMGQGAMAPGPMGQGSYGQFAFPTPPQQKFEPLAVAGVATSPLGPVGIALGLVARGRVKQTRRRSMGLAWTAVALGAVFTVVWGMLAAVLSLNGTIDRAFERPEAGDVQTARTIASANLAVGNCVATLPPANEVGEVRLVPCAESHIAQVVSQHELDGDFPGDVALAEQATATCTADVAAIDPGDASIVPWYLVPSEEGWAQGNTQVVCLLRGGTGPLTVDLVN